MNEELRGLEYEDEMYVHIGDLIKGIENNNVNKELIVKQLKEFGGFENGKDDAIIK